MKKSVFLTVTAFAVTVFGGDFALVRDGAAVGSYVFGGVDAVLHNGDISDWGVISGWRLAAEAWERVFPGDRAPDGRKVVKLFTAGTRICRSPTDTRYGKARSPQSVQATSRGVSRLSDTRTPAPSTGATSACGRCR